MNYSLMRESRVVIIFEGRAYGFDALANYSAETSYEEYKTLRRTIHRRKNYAYSKIVSQNPSSINLAINFAQGGIESNFFDWMGWDRNGDSLFLPQVTPEIEPIMFEMFIINTNTNLEFSNCYVSTVDFSLDNNVPILNVGIESGKFREVQQAVNSYSIDQGSVLSFSPPKVSSNGKQIPGLISASMSFQQQCEWRSGRSLFDVGRIYNNSRAIVNELNASATLSVYDTGHKMYDSFFGIEPSYDFPITIANEHIVVEFPSTRITKRLNLSDVYKLDYDIIPSEQSDPVSIHFRGENK